jgi:uncharacterized protein
MRTPAVTDPAAVLFGRSTRAVLRLLFGHPDSAFYLREIARSAGTSPSSLQRELAALTAAGLILREARGHQVYFRANPDSPVFEELRGIVIKTFGVADVVRSALDPLASSIQMAFIYGSLARGEARAQSDVDVMVIGDPAFADVVEKLQPAQVALSRAVNPTVYPAVEFSRKVKAGNGFLATVLREPKIFLIGDEGELRALAEGRTPQAPRTRKAGHRKPGRARR